MPRAGCVPPVFCLARGRGGAAASTAARGSASSTALAFVALASAFLLQGCSVGSVSKCKKLSIRNGQLQSSGEVVCDSNHTFSGKALVCKNDLIIVCPEVDEITGRPNDTDACVTKPGFVKQVDSEVEAEAFQAERNSKNKSQVPSRSEMERQAAKFQKQLRDTVKFETKCGEKRKKDDAKAEEKFQLRSIPAVASSQSHIGQLGMILCIALVSGAGLVVLSRRSGSSSRRALTDSYEEVEEELIQMEEERDDAPE